MSASKNGLKELENGAKFVKKNITKELIKKTFLKNATLN